MLRDVGNSDVTVDSAQRRNPQVQMPKWVGYVITLLLEAALTAGLAFLEPIFPLGQFPIPFVLLTMVIAYFFGMGPAIVSIFIGWLSFIYFFIPPLHQMWPLAVDAEGWARHVAFLLGVIVVSIATVQVRQSLQRIQAFADESARLNVSLREEMGERERAAEALRESEERYRTLFSTMSEGVAVCEIILDEQGKPCDWRYLELNPAFERNTGLTVDNTIGKTVREVLPNIEPYWIENYGRVALTGQSVRFENYLQELNRYFEVFAFSPTRGRFAVLFVDITERKQVEKALRESEESFRTMADAIPQLAWMADPDGYIFWYNQRWYEYTGTTPEQMKGWGWQRVHDPDMLPKVMERWKASIATGEPFDMEFPLLGAGGRFRWFLTRVMPLKDSEGRVTRWFGTNTDVSEKREIEEALRKLNTELDRRVAQRTVELQAANTELENANKELESFSYSVSHDLRTPLRAISGFSDALLKHYPDSLDARGQDYLRRVGAAAQRMGQLIDDILGLSRATRAELHRQCIDMSAMALEILDERGKSEPHRKVEVIVAPDMIVNADSHLLRIALDNLLGNAWKFTGYRDVARIEVGALYRNAERVYFVKDNGAGFNPARADKLFSPFQRLHSESDFPGTGIGLALVQRILRRHKGRIWAEGEVDKGATFYFTLGEADK